MDLEHRLRETLLETYRIERELGGGGMSRVFVAEEVAPGRRVALKVLSVDVSVDRFLRETQTVVKLRIPPSRSPRQARVTPSTWWTTSAAAVDVCLRPSMCG
jgi:serine/threonine protein kinase